MFSIIKSISVNIDNMHTYMCKYMDMCLHFLIIISGYISTKDIRGYLHLNVNICYQIPCTNIIPWKFLENGVTLE